MRPERSPALLIVSAALLALAAVCLFALRGYGYIGGALVLSAAACIAFYFAGKKLRRFLAALLIAGAAAFLAIELPILSDARTDAPDGCRYLIVLGAGVNGSAPSLSLATRLEAALDYLERNPDTAAVVSGGQGAGEDITEAACMRAWLEARGVAASRILEEDRATDTLENLRYSFALIEARGDSPQGCAVVSGAYHLCRAKLLARSLGAEVYGVAAPPGNFFVSLNYFIREGCGRVYYWVFGVE